MKEELSEQEQAILGELLDTMTSQGLNAVRVIHDISGGCGQAPNVIQHVLNEVNIKLKDA